MEPMSRPNVIPVDNETESSATRVTQERKQITYCMRVIQQPSRARACGAGAKSSADRRPVDPPPIVELKIYDGEGKQNDITFNMNANYFLFATLEQARPIAHGRVPEEKNRLTVLTGTPVAGMVYLERPTPAGYFIFPDLSVRHEGKYRLSFSLFEELKHSKDDDENETAAKAPGSSSAHVTNRLEVKSQPFVVFSAKKFPGLTESTSLSRMVAEQGCRVRIRRDVRMRRRDAKPGRDWDDYEDETAQARARMSATPDAGGYAAMPTPHGFIDPTARPRSASIASHHSLAASLSRRQSTQELSQGYQGYGTAPHTPQNASTQPSPYGPPSSQHFEQAPFMQQPSMHPPPMQYQPQAYPPPPAPPSNHAGYYGYAPPPPSAAVAHPHYAPLPVPYEQHRPSLDYSSQPPTEHRLSSASYSAPAPLPAPVPPQASFLVHPSAPAYAQGYAQPPPPPPPAQHVQPMYSNQHGHPPSSYSSHDSYGSNKPPPLQPVQPPARATGATTPLSARSSMDKAALLPPLQIPDSVNKLEASSPSASAPQSAYYTSSTPTESHKRSYGNVFNERHLAQPLRQGARPNPPFNPSSSIGSANGAYPGSVDDVETESDLDPNNMKMLYRRADGRSITRALPPHC